MRKRKRRLGCPQPPFSLKELKESRYAVRMASDLSPFTPAIAACAAASRAIGTR